MVRSMLSGVSGLKSHQTRMDTIGNNIANVNTYGFKSGRTTFRDIYYQTMSSASEPTAAAGGTNPSAVGYGTKVGSVDLMMGRSTFTMTSETMDIAIDGEGFFQVEDASGNKYYTRAGMLGFDAAGNLVDMQGNFVLGVNGDPTGRGPDSERIRVILPQVPATAASVTQTLNGREFTIKATNETIDGNLNFNFATDASVPDDTVTASISPTGIIVRFNPQNTYSSMAEFQQAVNNAITEANGGKEHPAGNFQISLSGDNPFAEGSLTAAEILSTDYGVQSGSVNFGGKTFYGLGVTGNVGTGFTGEGDVEDLTVTYQGGSPAQWQVELTVGGEKYVGYIDQNKTTTGKFNLVREGGTNDDYIEMSRPAFGTMVDDWNAAYGSPATKAVYTVGVPGAALTTSPISFAGVDGIAIDTGATVQQQAAAIAAAVTAGSAIWAASADSSGNITLTAKTAGDRTLDPGTVSAFGTISAAQPGEDAVTVTAGEGFDVVDRDELGGVAAKPSSPSRALGLSTTSFALSGGTAGGPQGIADMTNIYVAPNGVITGLDSQGLEVVIGRIDLATFANPSGLNQAGSSNYMESANSGVATLKQPGTEGSGQLVGGTLELSNVDLSNEFSDMITTQRGYQANSRIITVSDTMLEELINLKR